MPGGSMADCLKPPVLNCKGKQLLFESKRCVGRTEVKIPPRGNEMLLMLCKTAFMTEQHHILVTPGQTGH